MYRALNCPELTAGHLDEWNYDYSLYAFSKNSGASLDEVANEVSFGQTMGDRCLSLVNILRARMIPKKTWAADILNFVDNWESWKSNNGYMDFTDLIYTGLTDFDVAPGYPSIGFFDECQDFSRIQIELIRQWAENMDYIMMSGDDDQCIFSFSGASPDVFLNPPIEDKYKTILDQSYRVPAAVHVIAEKWIKQIKKREPKEYKPRDFEGKIIRADDDVTFAKPERLMQYLERVDEGKTIMILSTCAYMLNDTVKFLRDEGIPFHNPYRKTRGDWNPIKLGSAKRTTAIDRLLAFLLPSSGFPPVWGINDLNKWIDPLQSKGLLLRNAKKLIKKWHIEKKIIPDDESEYKNILYQLFEPQIVARLLGMLNSEIEIKWFLHHLLKAKSKVFEFPTRVIEKSGIDALQEPPQIIVGTVHCSPADELVLTVNRGYVPISKLIPKLDRVLSYDQKTNRLVGGTKVGGASLRNGYAILVKESKHYEGDMITIKTPKSKTRVTPNHFLQVRFTEAFVKKYVVYLMRRGEWWRVGRCVSAHRPYKSGGIGGRLATEQADGGWILGVFNNREEAITEEARIQGEYGIPGLTFEVAKTRSLTTDQVQAIHESTKLSVSVRVQRLLSEFGLDERWPLYTRATPKTDKVKRNMRGMFLTRAANLISDYMEIPVAPETFLKNEKQKRGYHKPEWFSITITKEHFEDEVFSLDIEKYHHYISGGAIVHNSVKGGECDDVILFPDLSFIASRQWIANDEGREAIIRQFYVGMTRCRERLILCAPSGAGSVRI